MQEFGTAAIHVMHCTWCAAWHWVYDLIKEDKAKLRVASEQCLTNM